MTRNDHGLRLYNGDLGLVVPGPEGREMLYTAITRARESVLLLSPGGVLEPRWLERSARASGLQGCLHGAQAS